MDIKMDTRYQPKDFEGRIYKKWLDAKAFEADNKSVKPYFSIVLPPPNITGQLHMGHALDHSIPDVLVRYKRMNGFETLWLPGTDHASIATEVKVWEAMEEEGIDTDATTREEFLERAWAWKDKYESRIIEQMKTLGNSCDWSRLRFTMDKNLNEAVTKVFVNLYNKGEIYKGYRLVNWCCDCDTSISDIEVEHVEKDSNFYHVKYFIKDSDRWLEVATTRPETIFGDTAVAVNPEDDRYKDLIGKTIIIPVVGREVKIIGDSYVDIELGTGALKVTPSHDPNDFEIGVRHKLDSINILNSNGTMNDEVPEEYRGLTRQDCRNKIVEHLKASDQLVKIVPLKHNVGQCYRCHQDIEPMMSNQWFVKMENLAKPALAALDDTLHFVPDRFGKIYTSWLEDIRDWCISRQLWWGHRIPAYYCDKCSHINVLDHMPEKCEKCGCTHLTQDEDVLDTWFSSALWPFSTLGWPHETDDLKKFYPTSVLVTGYDIIFFWVVRMAFSGFENMGETPFTDVLVHGLVRDEQGRKMSKSLGNGIDPLEIIDLYGADALKFMLISGNTPGNDQRFQKERVEAARNFANKLWNASRFVLMSANDLSGDLKAVKNFTTADKWILSRLNNLKREYHRNIASYDLSFAADKLYDFVWNEYCDWYIEIAKIAQYGTDEQAKADVDKILIYVLRQILMLLHPFMPFITEEIWGNFNDTLLTTTQMNEFNDDFEDLEAKENMEFIMNAIRSIRNARAEMNIPNSKKARLFVKTDLSSNIITDNSNYFVQLANTSEVSVITDKSQLPDDVISCVSDRCELFMPSDDLIDYSKEFDRLNKERSKIQSEVDRVIGKLNNQGFVAKAPEKLIEEEKAKQAKFEQMLEQIDESIAKIKSKL